MPKNATGIALAGHDCPTPARRTMRGRNRVGPRQPDVGVTRSTELRWFVPGAGPSLERVPVRSRLDSYRSDMLGDDVSVKSRVGHGAGVFAKRRCAVLAPVAIGDLRGMPETWTRWEVGDLLQTGAEVHVHKDVARRNGVEVAHLTVHDEKWWSVAVRVRGSEVPRLPLDIEAHLSRRRADALCCSYPTWLGLRSLGRRRP